VSIIPLKNKKGLLKLVFNYREIVFVLRACLKIVQNNIWIDWLKVKLKQENHVYPKEIKVNNSKLDLNEREFGYWFAPFERELIWVKNQEHIGWVVHTSNQTFKLQYTPFYKQYKNYTYIAPTLELMPPENMCVEIKPLKIVRKVKFSGKGLYGEHDNYCIIDGFKEYKIKTQKPSIGYKDFIYHCTNNWDNAEDEDHLGLMIALQLVSCPPSFYGEGGIGAIASKYSGYADLSKKIVPQLKGTYKGVLPTNFRKVNDKYFFHLITTSTDINNINQIRQKSLCEVNYCRPCTTYEDANITTADIPIQIPLLIRYAKYKKSAGLGEIYLLLQYQLTALQQYPNFGNNNSALKNIENNIKKIIEERVHENTFAFDNNSINKLTSSFSRLYLTAEVSNKEIRDATDYFFGNLEDWKSYLNMSKSTNDYRNKTTPTDIQMNLSHDHQRFLVELQKLHDETKEKWINRQNLEKNLERKIKSDFYEIAKDLNNLGLIIQQNNFSKLRNILDI
jgi:hypothetical protein